MKLSNNHQQQQERHWQQPANSPTNKEATSNKKKFILPHEGKIGDNIVKSMKGSVQKLLLETVYTQITHTGRKLVEYLFSS